MLAREAELAAMRSRAARRVRWLSAGGGGLAVALAFFHRYVQEQVTALLDRTLILGYLVLVFTLVVYGLLFRIALPRLRAAGRAPVAWGLGALALGCLLTAALARQPAQPRPHTLEIIATGQRNPAARGSEVWVTGLYRADGSQVAVSELALEGDWEIRDGVPLSYRNQPATLRWTGALDGDAELRLVAHPWSGIIQLRWDDQTQTIDLYADPATTKAIVLPTIPAVGGRWTPILRVVFWSADAISLGLLVFLLGALFAGERAPAKQLAWGLWRRRWLLVPVLALPLAWLIAPVVLSDGVPEHGLRPIDYAAAWLYAVGLLGVCVCLTYDSDQLFALIPARFPHRLRWLGNTVFGQPLGAWLLAVPVAVVVAALLVSRIGLGEQRHAVWVKLALDSRSGTAPAAQLRYGSAAGDVVPFQWQPDAESVVAVRSIDQQPIQVVAVETDQGPLALDRVTVTPGERGPKGLIINPAGSLLSWPEPSRAITLTLAAGSGSAEVLWFDQQTTAMLGAQPVRAALRLPAAFQGWALVPPQEIRQLELELPAKDDAYTIRELTVWNDPPQLWPGDGAAPAWVAQGCARQPEVTGAVVVATTASAACRVQVPDVRAINVVEREQRFLAIALVAVLGMGLLWALPRLANYGRRFTAGYGGAENALGGWLRQRTEHWHLGTVLWIVWGVALAFHLLYALTVPLTYTNDSVDYYSLGRAFAQAPWFASVDTTVRTPGYPVFIASVLALFGDTALWIVIVQHLALALLAPLTVWALARHLPLLAAALAGVLAGIAPALATTANILWTESLYAALTTAALLVYVGSGDHLRGLLVAGMLAGAATMVRPTGLLVLLVLLGWLLLCGWCNPSRPMQQRFALAGCVALLAGYLMMAGPWHLRLGLVDGTTDLSKGHANFTAWAAAVYQRRIDAALAINRPVRAVWAVPAAWGQDPFALIRAYPQVQKVSAANTQAYYTEALGEAARANPARLRENLRAALIYNLTLTTGDSSYVYWAEIRWILKYWDAPVQELPPATPEEPVRQQLDRMIYRWQPEKAPMRSTLIRMSWFILEHWILLSIPALLGGGGLFAHSLLRRVVPGWLYWIGLVIATSALGMPAERYVVVIEPVLYIIVVTVLYAIACLRYRSATRVAPIEAAVSPARIPEA